MKSKSILRYIGDPLIIFLITASVCRYQPTTSGNYVKKQHEKQTFPHGSVLTQQDGGELRSCGEVV